MQLRLIVSSFILLGKTYGLSQSQDWHPFAGYLCLLEMCLPNALHLMVPKEQRTAGVLQSSNPVLEDYYHGGSIPKYGYSWPSFIITYKCYGIHNLIYGLGYHQINKIKSNIFLYSNKYIGWEKLISIII